MGKEITLVTSEQAKFTPRQVAEMAHMLKGSGLSRSAAHRFLRDESPLLDWKSPRQALSEGKRRDVQDAIQTIYWG